MNGTLAVRAQSVGLAEPVAVCEGSRPRYFFGLVMASRSASDFCIRAMMSL